MISRDTPPMGGCMGGLVDEWFSGSMGQWVSQVITKY